MPFKNSSYGEFILCIFNRIKQSFIFLKILQKNLFPILPYFQYLCSMNLYFDRFPQLSRVLMDNGSLHMGDAVFSSCVGSIPEDVGVP